MTSRRRAFLVLGAVAGFLGCLAPVYGSTFTAAYGSSTLDSVEVLQSSTHTFVVDTPFLIMKNTEWYLSYSGGSPVETDSSSTSDPQYTQSFPSAGTYWVRAEIYDSDWNWEEAHRWEVAVTDETKPDMVVDNIWTDPSPVITGEQYVIRALIRNQGDALAEVALGAQDAQFYIDGVSVGGDLYDNVSPGAAIEIQSPMLTGPADGTYELRVAVDANDEVDEWVEGNNDRTESLLISSDSAPDLIVEDIWTEPASPTEGQSFVIKASVRNRGDETASVALGSQEALFYIDGSMVDTAAYDDVVPGATVTVQSSVPAGLSNGDHALRVIADGYSEVAESVEDNNSRTEGLSIGSGSGSDMIVQSISVDPGYAWQPATVTALIKNQGTSTAEFGFLDRVCRFEVNGQIEHVTLWSPLSIPPGGTYPAHDNMTVTRTGTLDVAVIVDPDNDVSESIEGNNTLTVQHAWIVHPTADSDSDGMKDVDEFVAGTDPGSISNVLSCSVSVTGSVSVLSWPSVSNRFYSVDASTDLMAGFATIASNIPANPPCNTYTNALGANGFYRVMVRE